MLTLENILDLDTRFLVELNETRYDYHLNDGDLVLLDGGNPVEWIPLDTEVKVTKNGIELEYEQGGGEKTRGLIKLVRSLRPSGVGDQEEEIGWFVAKEGTTIMVWVPQGRSAESGSTC